MDVGNRLRALREAAGLTVNKLANLSGISQSHLRAIELGDKNPTVETLSYFCDTLGISLKEFFTETETEISPQLLTAISNLTPEQQQSLAKFLSDME